LAFLHQSLLVAFFGQLFITLLQGCESVIAFAAQLLGSNVLCILKESLATQSAFKVLNGGQGHARADFDKNKLVWVVCLLKHSLLVVHNLVAAQMHLFVQNRKGNHVVDKGLRLGVIFWSVKDLSEHFFGELPLWLLVKDSIERKQRS
jgi:hypothetical protein